MRCIPGYRKCLKRILMLAVLYFFIKTAFRIRNHRRNKLKDLISNNNFEYNIKEDFHSQTTTHVLNYNIGNETKELDERQLQNSLQLPKVEFLNNYKNPCWNEVDGNNDTGTTTLKCVPFFYLAGVEKCGTTDLYESLIKHNYIMPSSDKEPHYWAKGRLNTGATFNNYADGFQTATLGIEKGVLSSEQHETNYHPFITLDASADTFMSNFALRYYGFELLDNEEKMSEILTPFLIHKLTPNAKFIVIVRDPAERLYSSYNYFPMVKRAAGSQRNVNSTFKNRRTRIAESLASKSPQDFHEKVVQAIEWFVNCQKQFPTSQRCYFWNEAQSDLDNFISHMQIGLYGPNLLTWLKVFPIESFKVIRLEDYRTKKLELLGEIFEFLQLPAAAESVIEEIKAMDRVNVGKLHMKHGPMLLDTKQLLSGFYFPFNKMLSEICDCPKFLFDDE